MRLFDRDRSCRRRRELGHVGYPGHPREPTQSDGSLTCSVVGHELGPLEVRASARLFCADQTAAPSPTCPPSPSARSSSSSPASPSAASPCSDLSLRPSVRPICTSALPSPRTASRRALAASCRLTILTKDARCAARHVLRLCGTATMPDAQGEPGGALRRRRLAASPRLSIDGLADWQAFRAAATRTTAASTGSTRLACAISPASSTGRSARTGAARRRDESDAPATAASTASLPTASRGSASPSGRNSCLSNVRRAATFAADRPGFNTLAPMTCVSTDCSLLAPTATVKTAYAGPAGAFAWSGTSLSLRLRLSPRPSAGSRSS